MRRLRLVPKYYPVNESPVLVVHLGNVGRCRSPPQVEGDVGVPTRPERHGAADGMNCNTTVDVSRPADRI